MSVEQSSNESSHSMRQNTIDLEDSIEPTLHLPSDTELVIDSIQSAAEKQFGFVLQHQIYATLSNRSIVDEELHSLRHTSKSFKFLQCDFTKSSSGSIFPNATLIIKTKWYNNSISQFLSANKSLEFTPDADELLRLKFTKWAETSSQMSVFRHELKKKELWITPSIVPFTRKRNFSSVDDPISLDDDGEVSCSLTEAEIDRLIQVGFLHYRNTSSAEHEVFNHGNSTSGSRISSSGAGQYDTVTSSRDQELYWLAHPAMRSLVRCLQNAEQSIVSQIRKGQYKELSEKKLRNLCRESSTDGAKPSKKVTQGKSLLGNSPFPLSYHLLDLEGRRVLYKVTAPATNDFIWRIKA